MLLEDAPQIKLNPKFDYQKSKTNSDLSKDATFMTNYYPIELNKKLKEIYQYSIEFEPILPEDATKVADRIIDSVYKQIKNKLGFICFKGRTLWGVTLSQIPVVIKTQITVKEEKKIYEILIRTSANITISDFISKDQQNLIKLSQVLNVNTKIILKNIGFKQLDKGTFYDDSDLDVQRIQKAGLSVLRGYQVNVTCANHKLYLKADACSRILRTESFLQTMKSTERVNQKEYINQTFKNKSVIKRYGNHKIYRIIQIDYSMTPNSTKTNYDTQTIQTYIEYYRTVYNCEIKQHNQPLIKIIAKMGLKDEIHFLVPELVSLTGLTQDQTSDFKLMKAIEQKTKFGADKRIFETNKIISLINNEGKDQLMYSIIQKPQQFPGKVIYPPAIQMGGQKEIYPEKGFFNLRGKIKDPVVLKKYYFVYTARRDEDHSDADACIGYLQQASKSFGIKLDKPIFIDIKAKKGEILTSNNWINQIQQENKNVKPELIIFYFNMDQLECNKLYEQLKNYCINELKINSQVITKRTLRVGANGAMSKASKILLQINDKMGHPLYTVEKQHPFWAKNTIAIGSIAVSGGPKGTTVSFVGTRNNQLTQHFSDFSKISRKQALPQVIIERFVLSWLKQYFKTDGKTLPSTLIIYREGLNDKQANKVLMQEISCIQKTFKIVSERAKVQNWKPYLVYILVNQKDGTRIYLIDKDNKLSNPLPGTIVGSQLSKDNSYEFFMSSTSIIQGTCNMMQYKVVYDSSNQKVPDEAIKTITYEQCYNYPNWNGAIKFPETLQKANKLAKFVSMYGQKNIDKDNPLKVLDYYI